MTKWTGWKIRSVPCKRQHLRLQPHHPKVSIAPLGPQCNLLKMGDRLLSRPLHLGPWVTNKRTKITHRHRNAQVGSRIITNRSLLDRLKNGSNKIMHKGSGPQVNRLTPLMDKRHPNRQCNRQIHLRTRATHRLMTDRDAISVATYVDEKAVIRETILMLDHRRFQLDDSGLTIGHKHRQFLRY